VLLALTQQWLLVSDLHLDPFDHGSQPADYQQDTNPVLFDSAVARMHKVAAGARVVVIDGDFLAHQFDQKAKAGAPNQTVSALAVQTMARIERSFAQAFPRAQFLIAMGNNDDPCGDYRTAPNTPYLAQLARIWAPLVNRNGASPAFIRDFSRTGSYISRLPVPGLRAIVADDVYWSFFYRPCRGGVSGMPRAEMNWFTQAVRAVPPGQRSVVVLHIPPGIDPSSTLLAQRFLVVPFWRNDMTARFTQALGENESRVAFVVAGHLHRNDFRIAGGAPILISPAISPVYSNNPAFLTLQIDGRGTLRDYQMYAFDLYSDTWSRVFDYDSAYSVDNFTARSIEAAHARIGRDDAMRERWERALLADSGAYKARYVWRAFWCAQTELRGGYAACAGDQRRVVLLPIGLALLALVIVLAVTALVVRRGRHRRRT